uniref:Zgc:174945 n=1 Tax=Sinocyclocheilus anshuiensis TaxID=1608454 RepID=A0A671RYD0_9TELE
MQIFHPTTAFLIMVVLCSLLWQWIQDCDIQTNWWYLNIRESVQITDPSRYLITVNETERDEYRLRNIFLTLNSLRCSDSGFYQNIILILTDPYKGLKFSAWSGQLKADAAALALSAILLILWCY